LILDQTSGEVALGHLLLAAENGDADSEVGGGLQEPVLRVDGDAAGTAEGLDRKLTLHASDVDAANLGFAIGHLFSKRNQYAADGPEIRHPVYLHLAIYS